jgi:glycosyltransferase involved in cell wall biosynthesis
MTSQYPKRQPSFSIITVCLNSEKYIEQTIQSILNQTYQNFNYIIIDGGSTDKTLQIIENYKKQWPDKLSYVSQPDQGLYDAMNKGLAFCEDPETYVIFLNSDDYFYNDHVLETISTSANNAEFIYGKVELINGENKRIFGYKYNKQRILVRTICHQAIFTQRRLFDQLGFFNIVYKIAADFDFVTRVFKKTSIKRRFLPIIISSVRTTGLSTLSGLLGRSEYLKVLEENYNFKNNKWEFFFMVFNIYPKVLLLNLIYYLKLDKLRIRLKYLRKE